MDIYVARQPIFNRHMDLYGYELLYRKSENNFYEGNDHNGATAELVHNSFLVMNFDTLTDGTRGFINFPRELLEDETPIILPNDKVVIEILENVTVTDRIIKKCKRLKSEGYTIALDDFIFNRKDCDYTPLIEVADIIKVEFPYADRQEQRELIRRYKNRILFLAEKVETREDFREAAEMGYELFQGHFFCKPLMVRAKEIDSKKIHLIRIQDELNKNEPDFSLIKETIQKDLGLCFKLLKIMNSSNSEGNQEISYTKHAVTHLGVEELKRWISIMLTKEYQNQENFELLKICLLRGKLMALMSRELNHEALEDDFFLTGVLSSIDVIINDCMENILHSLALSKEVKDALLGKPGMIRTCLQCILDYERFEFDLAKEKLQSIGLTLERFMDLYMDGLAWLRTTDE